MKSLLAALALSTALLAPAAFAEDVKAGDIVIEKPWARATPKGSAVGAGYLTLHNHGATPDRLTGGAADFASVEIHDMRTENGVMTMRELREGLNLPAHATVKLAPGGYHIMFTHLTKPLTKGESVTATLNFEKAGAIAVSFPVEGLGAGAPAEGAKHDMSGHDGMDMKH